MDKNLSRYLGLSITLFKIQLKSCSKFYRTAFCKNCLNVSYNIHVYYSFRTLYLNIRNSSYFAPRNQ